MRSIMLGRSKTDQSERAPLPGPFASYRFLVDFLAAFLAGAFFFAAFFAGAFLAAFLAAAFFAAIHPPFTIDGADTVPATQHVIHGVIEFSVLSLGGFGSLGGDA